MALACRVAIVYVVRELRQSYYSLSTTTALRLLYCYELIDVVFGSRTFGVHVLLPYWNSCINVTGWRRALRTVLGFR